MIQKQKIKMKKVIIMEDNRTLIDVLKIVINQKFPECEIVEFGHAGEAKMYVSSGKEFDVLFLDGNLGWFSEHGEIVLHALSEEQIKKTIVCSADDTFIDQAKAKGVTVFLEGGFAGIRISKIGEYVLETINKLKS